MKKSYTHIIAFLLSVFLCVGILPTVVFAEEVTTPTWPRLKELSIEADTKLTARGVGANDRSLDRLVTGVTFENYSTGLRNDGMNKPKTQQNYAVGKITLHVEEAPSESWDYELPANVLSYKLDGLTEDVALTGGLDAARPFPRGKQTGTKFSFCWTNASGTKTNPKKVYYYDIAYIVDSTGKTWDYPVIEQVILNDYDKLFTTGGQAITITGLKLENYDAAVLDSTTDNGTQKLIAGEITAYITQEPDAQKTYSLNDQSGHNAISIEVNSVEGFIVGQQGVISGSFEAGQKETISPKYAYSTDNTKTYHYKMKLQVSYPDDGVYVFDGTGTRIAPTKARVTFNANQAGTYHYAVVDAAATDVPAMPDTGAAMTAGENTVVIDGLAEGAKKVYIWGKSGDKVSARPVVVDIGATAKSYSLSFNTTNAATDGIFRITADDKDVSFKTSIMVTPTTTAKGIYEGQEVTVRMGNPHTDQDLSAVTLRNVKDVTIAPDKNSFSFTMPAADVVGAGEWRTYVESIETRYTLTGTTTTFDQTNVTGIPMGKVIFKDTDGNIITQAKKGTVVKATPVPYTANQNLAFAFTEWSNANGFTLDAANKADNPLTFTVGTENVSLKANFEPEGTLVTWGTNITSPDANAPQVSMPGAVSSPYVFKHQTVSAYISGTAWYDRYKFEGWEVKRDGEMLTNVDVSQTNGLDPKTPGYWTWAKFDIDGTKMTVTAKFEERIFAYVNVEANDAAMGSATVSVNGSEAAASKLVFEGQTVTLTATPKSQRYMLDPETPWTVKDSSGAAIEFTPVTEGDNTQVIFTMPSTGNDITATANFVVDTSKPNDDCSLERVELWSADGAKLLSSSNKSGDTYTIELPASVAVSELPNLRLKFICGDAANAVVKQGNTEWSKDGQACGITTLGQTQVFTVVAEDGQTSAPYKVVINAETKITAVTLLNGTETIASGKLSGSKWTITLPDSIDADLLAKIGASDTIFMKIEYAGKSLKQVATTNGTGYDDAGQKDSWASGKIMCAISPGSEAQFIVTGIDGLTRKYTIAITQPNVSTTPVLTKVSVERTSDNAATVKFTSSMAGNYFYKVVEKGAAAPTVDTTKGGTTAVKGENTITLTNLSAGARDIYIVVKSLSNVECDPFKIEIPAYGSTETPDEGDFTISVNAPPTGGTITTNRTKANEGDEIIVTVTPKAGYQMKAGSLRYAFSAPGAAYTTITGNSFKMPGGDVSITCDWETASTTVNGITAFSINGIAAAVNNTTNTITITMPRGTDVTKLTPVIATNGVKSLTPGSGVTVDFTNAVTYTATMDDGSTKTYTVTVYVDKGTLADQFWDKLTDFVNQVPWWEYAKHQQSTSKYPKYW